MNIEDLKTIAKRFEHQWGGIRPMLVLGAGDQWQIWDPRDVSYGGEYPVATVVNGEPLLNPHYAPLY